LAMLAAITAASVGAGMSLWDNTGLVGVAAAAGFMLLAAVMGRRA